MGVLTATPSPKTHERQLRGKNLDAEMGAVLRDMSLLSEVNSKSVGEVHVGSGKPEAKPPPGFQDNRDSKKPPPKDFSLYEHYRWRYQRARDDLQRRVIFCQARAALRERKKGPEPWQARWNYDEEDDIKVLIEDGEGVHIAELAAVTGWPHHWIATQRERNGREPTFGNPRPRWQKLSEDEKSYQGRYLFAEGHSLRGAAKVLGIAPSTLLRWWPKRND